MILTSRLVLVPISYFSFPRPEQVETFVGWLNDPEVVKYSEQRHYEHSVDSQESYWTRIQDEPKRYWFIKNKNDGPSDVIGAISADYDEDNLTSNISIMIGDRNYWGKGFGKEAFGAVIENEKAIGMEKVEAGMMVTNAPMIRTCLACGMQRDAIVLDHFKVGEERIGMILMGKRL